MITSIQGYRQSGTYIAAQGPLESTVNDFWRMVWEEESKCIVMLCDLTEDEEVKCTRLEKTHPNLTIPALHSM